MYSLFLVFLHHVSFSATLATLENESSSSLMTLDIRATGKLSPTNSASRCEFILRFLDPLAYASTSSAGRKIDAALLYPLDGVIYLVPKGIILRIVKLLW